MAVELGEKDEGLQTDKCGLGTLPSPGAGTAPGSAGQGFQRCFSPARWQPLPKHSLLSASPAPQSQAHTPAGPKDVTDQEHINESGPLPLNTRSKAVAAFPRAGTEPLGSKQGCPCCQLPALTRDPRWRHLPGVSPALLAMGTWAPASLRDTTQGTPRWSSRG